MGREEEPGQKTKNPSLPSLLPGRSEGLVSTWDPKSRTKAAGPRQGTERGSSARTLGVPNDGG